MDRTEGTPSLKVWHDTAVMGEDRVSVIFQQYPAVRNADNDHLYNYKCSRSGCDMVGNECVCTSGGCDRMFQFPDLASCYKSQMKRLCANVTCPELEVPTCPPDSVLTKPHTPYGECCPTIPRYCTCNFNRCVNNCPNGKRKVTIWKTKGEPGSCCNRNLCLL